MKVHSYSVPLHNRKKTNLNTQRNISLTSEKTSPVKVPLCKITNTAFCGIFSFIKVNKRPKLIDAGYKLYPIKALNIKTKQKEAAFLGFYNANNRAGFLKIFDTKGEDISIVLQQFNEHEQKNSAVKYLRLKNLTKFKEHYNGIGSKLIQASIEQSLAKGFDGRIKVQAVNVMSDNIGDPFVFYKKMGFSIIDFNKTHREIGLNEIINISAQPENVKNLAKHTFNIKELADKSIITDEQIFNFYNGVSQITNTPINKIKLGFEAPMYLHADTVQTFWLPKIKANPIFNEINRLK